MGWITDMHDSLLSRDDDEHARDEAQAELFRTYLTDQYADDGDVTLNLTPDATFTDAEQLRQYRAEMAGLEPLPFDAISDEDMEA